MVMDGHHSFERFSVKNILFITQECSFVESSARIAVKMLQLAVLRHLAQFTRLILNNGFKTYDLESVRFAGAVN